MKMIHYKVIKTTIDISGLAEVIINVMIRYYGLSDEIISDRSLLSIFGCWFLLYQFLDIKHELSITFYSQTNGQTKR